MRRLLLLVVLRKENIEVIEEREKTTASVYVMLQKNITKRKAKTTFFLF